MLRGTGTLAHHPHLYTSGGARTDLCGSTRERKHLPPASRPGYYAFVSQVLALRV